MRMYLFNGLLCWNNKGTVRLKDMCLVSCGDKVIYTNDFFPPIHIVKTDVFTQSSYCTFQWQASLSAPQRKAPLSIGHNKWSTRSGIVDTLSLPEWLRSISVRSVAPTETWCPLCETYILKITTFFVALCSERQTPRAKHCFFKT